MFPLTGPYKDGHHSKITDLVKENVWARRRHKLSLSSQTLPIAGGTGASVTEDVWKPSDQTVDGQVVHNELYSVKFIQLSSATPEDAVPSPLTEASANVGQHLHSPLKRWG